jgi:hypothetical protein
LGWFRVAENIMVVQRERERERRTEDKQEIKKTKEWGGEAIIRRWTSVQAVREN